MVDNETRRITVFAGAWCGGKANNKSSVERRSTENEEEPSDKEKRKEEAVSTTSIPDETDIGQHEHEEEVFDFEGKTVIAGKERKVILLNIEQKSSTIIFKHLIHYSFSKNCEFIPFKDKTANNPQTKPHTNYSYRVFLSQKLKGEKGIPKLSPHTKNHNLYILTTQPYYHG